MDQPPQLLYGLASRGGAAWKITGVIEDTSQTVLAASGELGTRNGPGAHRMGEALGLREWESHLSSPSHEWRHISAPEDTKEPPGLEAFLEATLDILGWLPWCVPEEDLLWCSKIRSY